MGTLLFYTILLADASCGLKIISWNLDFLHKSKAVVALIALMQILAGIHPMDPAALRKCRFSSVTKIIVEIWINAKILTSA